jgi:O-antigen/teichoic acid export membrane protein
MRTYLIANIVSLVALFVGVINMITYREIWILIAAASILIILAIYTIREKNKLKQNQKKQSYRHNPI